MSIRNENEATRLWELGADFLKAVERSLTALEGRTALAGDRLRQREVEVRASAMAVDIILGVAAERTEKLRRDLVLEVKELLSQPVAPPARRSGGKRRAQRSRAK